MRILILEDERDARDSLSILLRSKGHSVITCDNGEMGLKLLCTTRYDGVLVDLFMPKANGWEFIDRLENLQIRVPCVIISGYSDIEPPSKYSLIPVVKKPYEFDDLVRVIESTFSKKT